MPQDVLTPGEDPLEIDWIYPTVSLLGKSAQDLRTSIPIQPDITTYVPPSAKRWARLTYRTTGKTRASVTVDVFVTYEIENDGVVLVEIGTETHASRIRIARGSKKLVIVLTSRTAETARDASMWSRFAVEFALNTPHDTLPPFMEAELYL